MGVAGLEDVSAGNLKDLLVSSGLNIQEPVYRQACSVILPTWPTNSNVLQNFQTAF